MAVRWTFLSAPSWPIDTNILFTINTECNGKILVSCRNGVIVVDVYRKSPHRDRYLDFNSHHDNQHKVSTASTLLHRALNLPNSSKRKKPELIMFMQFWSPTVIHLSLSKTYRLKNSILNNKCIPRRTCWNVFQDGWTNRVTQVSRFSSLLQRSNWAFDTCPQKTRCHSCKQTIYHSTTTIRSPEILTFDGIADKSRV